MGGGTHLSKVIPVRLVSSKNKTLCVVLRYVPDRYFKRPTAIAAVGCWWWGGRQAGRQIKKKRGRERIYYGTVSSLAARVLRRYCSETIPRYSEDASWRSRTRFCQANWEGGLGLSTYSIVVGVRPAESGPTRQGHRSTTGRVGSPPHGSTKVRCGSPSFTYACKSPNGSTLHLFFFLNRGPGTRSLPTLGGLRYTLTFML